MNRRTEPGFTLIEITVAIAVLSLALTTLIGLHTSLIDTYFNERNRTKAAFYAQYMMTMLEVQQDPPEIGTKEGDLEQELDKMGFFGSDSLSQTKDPLDGWQFSQEVSGADLPLIEDALRRVDLSISWGEQEEQTYTLLYFLNNPQLAEAVSNALGGGPPGANN